jgi:hypothetical protein
MPANPDAVAAETIQRWHDAGAVGWLGGVAGLAPVLAATDVLAVPTSYPGRDPAGTVGGRGVRLRAGGTRHRRLSRGRRPRPQAACWWPRRIRQR